MTNTASEAKKQEFLDDVAKRLFASVCIEIAKMCVEKGEVVPVGMAELTAKGAYEDAEALWNEREKRYGVKDGK